MERVAIYARVSTNAQEKQETIETQLMVAREFCQQQEFQVAAEFTDEGVSGTVPFDERPHGGVKLLEFLRSEKGITRTVVYDLSRIGREQLVSLLAEKTLKVLGAPVLSATQPLPEDEKSVAGVASRSTYRLVNELYRAMVRENTMAGRRRRVLGGKYQASHAAYGYSYQPCTCPRRPCTDPAHGLLTPHPEQADVVQRMFKWSAEGASVYEIVRRLEADGVKPPGEERGHKNRWGWHAVTVRKLLRSARYVGRGHYGTEVMAYPPLVSEELFATVQRGMSERRYRSAGNTRYFYPLQGLLWCGHCGTRYGARRFMRNHKSTAVYACQQRATYGRAKAGHDGVKWTWDAAEMEERLRDYALDLLVNPERLVSSAQLVAQEARAALAGVEERRAKLEARLTALDGEERDALRRARQKLTTDAQLAVELSDITAERQQVKRALAALDEEASTNIDREETALLILEQSPLLKEVRKLIPDPAAVGRACLAEFPEAEREAFDRLLWRMLRTVTERVTVQDNGALFVEGVLETSLIQEPTSR